MTAKPLEVGWGSTLTPLSRLASKPDYVARGLVGVSVDEAEFQAGMLHHHYPCLAEMAGTRTSATR